MHERALNKLTATAVRNLCEPGRYPDGGGLALAISGNGGKRWLLRYRDAAGQRREMGLGPATGMAAVPLKEARERAAEARRMARDGTDPINARREAKAERAAAARAVAFGAYYETVFLPQKRPGPGDKPWGRAVAREWETAFPNACAPVWKKKLRDVTREDVLGILRPIWDTKHSWAQKVQNRLSQVFAYARQNGETDGENPAEWKLLDRTLSRKKRGATKRHFPAMEREDVPGFLSALRGMSGIAARALELLILTATRNGEARGARWDEFDLDRGLWTIPAERMKAGREHVIPLSQAAVALVRSMEPLREGEFVFAKGASGAARKDGTARPGHLSEAAMNAVMKRMGPAANRRGETPVPHGFRATFRGWAGAETEFPEELAEEALAHQKGTVERAYDREPKIERRRLMMEAWAAFCEGRSASANVVPLGTARGARAVA